eukprot:16047315-Heterocapsa_arctica.AAC.1
MQAEKESASTVFQKCFNCSPKVLQELSKSVQMENASKVIQKCAKSGKQMIQQCSKRAPKVIQN